MHKVGLRKASTGSLPSVVSQHSERQPASQLEEDWVSKAENEFNVDSTWHGFTKQFQFNLICLTLYELSLLGEGEGGGDNAIHHNCSAKGGPPLF